jgi:protein-L-isoaspartate O-methyltransferase
VTGTGQGQEPRRELSRLPHPVLIHDGPQLISMIGQLEAGTYPRPEDAVWRSDLPRELAVRLARATGATEEDIAETTAADDAEAAERAVLAAEAEAGARGSTIAGVAANGDLTVIAQTSRHGITEGPGDEPGQLAAEDADVIIRHTHEDGTLVYGTSKGDGVYELIGPRTAARFRYMPSIKMIGIPQSRDHLAKRWQIEEARKALESAGFTVAVEIDDTPRDVAQVKTDRAERLDARYDRLSAKATRRAAEGEARQDRANQLAERFSGGQPILVGHHSERGARADKKRIDQNDRAARDAFAEAERAAAAAAVVGKADAYRERPAVIIRRIAKTESDLRVTCHQINGTRPANDWRGAYGLDRKPATGEWLEQLNARKTFLEHQLAADRAALAEHEASGYIRLTRETVHKNDRVFWGAAWGEGIGGAIVTRVNPKTVTLNRTSYPRTLPYEQIQKVECPHKGSTVTVQAPRRKEARPRPAPVTVTPPPEREAPLTVDAATEFFPTPAAVVDRMIAVAELGPDMDVLEPSAGLGAIASRVAPLVSTVDCIERSAQLADRLLAIMPPKAGLVQCADFLEIQPNPVLSYDRVMMNPPFSGQAGIRHVTHALSFLRPGGLLIAIMSAGAESRQDKTTAGFRRLVADRGGRIERLPDDAFDTSGTSVRTVMAVIPAGTGEKACDRPPPAPAVPAPAQPQAASRRTPDSADLLGRLRKLSAQIQPGVQGSLFDEEAPSAGQ